MPSSTPKQKRTMQAAKHNPAFASKMGIPQDVAAEFVAADKKRGPPAFCKGGKVISTRRM